MNEWDMTPFFNAVTDACLAYYGSTELPDLWELTTGLMDLPGLPMHCPVHHYIVPAALLTVCRKKQGHGREVIERDLFEALKRSQNVLGGFCGYYGACGAAVGLGIFWSIITDTTPMSRETWAYGNCACGKALMDIAQYGGPRCCKRTVFTALSSALPEINGVLRMDLALPQPLKCAYNAHNKECLRQRCPYYNAPERA